MQHIKIWDTAKAMLRRRLIVLNAYIYKGKKSQISNLSSYLKKLEKKKKQNKSKAEGIKS